jgi:hypothetical protein
MTLSYFNGGAIVSNDDSGGPDSYFRVTIPKDGEYVLSITDHLGKGGPTYFYRVEFLPVKATARVSIPQVAQYSQERQSIAVPKGNRMATLVTVSRNNFGGDVVLGAEGLPAGVTMHAEHMPGNLVTIPVVFEAAPTAAVGATLGKLTARHADPKHPPVGSEFYQMAEMVLGPPGVSLFWKLEVDRYASTVTQEVPFSVRIVEPKAPLVQNGTMNLKIVAERKAGFNGPITILPLFNPPGVSSASSAAIPAGKTETTLIMNAAGNAQVRKWKTAVLATATVGDGPVWVSSQLAALDVAAPFVAFQMDRAACEQGKETELVCKVQQVTPFAGTAKVKLLNLPFKATAPDAEITKDTKEVVFKITV